MKFPLFVFGSLRDPDVLEVVVGRSLGGIQTVPAVLRGYRVARLPDESYPVLLACADQEVEGVLVQGLTEEDFARIRFFENEEYRFERCWVVLEGGSRQQALYCSEGVTAPGACEPWTLEDWQLLHKAGFIEDAKRFMSLYDRMSSEEADREWRRWKE